MIDDLRTKKSQIISVKNNIFTANRNSVVVCLHDTHDQNDNLSSLTTLTHSSNSGNNNNISLITINNQKFSDCMIKVNQFQVSEAIFSKNDNSNDHSNDHSDDHSNLIKLNYNYCELKTNDGVGNGDGGVRNLTPNLVVDNKNMINCLYHDNINDLNSKNECKLLSKTSSCDLFSSSSSSSTFSTTKNSFFTNNNHGPLCDRNHNESQSMGSMESQFMGSSNSINSCDEDVSKLKQKIDNKKDKKEMTSTSSRMRQTIKGHLFFKKHHVHLSSSTTSTLMKNKRIKMLSHQAKKLRDCIMLRHINLKEPKANIIGKHIRFLKEGYISSTLDLTDDKNEFVNTTNAITATSTFQIQKHHKQTRK